MSLAWYSSIVESAIIHWMPCFSASSEPWAKRLRDRSHHHVERQLRLGDPAHAVGQPGRPEAVLAEQVALTAATQHGARRDPQVLDADLGVAHADVLELGGEREVDLHCRVSVSR